ncbi:MAG: hypothetical protein WC376_01515 [Candidatus Nanoarchaeia archaeon]|jgi:hypothetical protein
MNLSNYCAELSRWLPTKYHPEVYFVGGVLLNRQITDVDIFVYGKHASAIEMKLYGKFFSDNKELEVLTSLSTDDFEDSKGNNLTEYILTQGLTKNISSFGFNRLTVEGLFLSKLAAFEQRGDETLKDLADIEFLLKRFENKIPETLITIMNDFDLHETYLRIEEYGQRFDYY